jgi:hypothetical protein
MDLTYQGELRRVALAARRVLERAQVEGRRQDCLRLAVNCLDGALRNVVSEDKPVTASAIESAPPAPEPPTHGK